MCQWIACWELPTEPRKPFGRSKGARVCMANLLAIHSVGASVITYLRTSYPENLRDKHSCEFRLLSSGELSEKGVDDTTVTLFLYRITMNEHLRNISRGPDLATIRPPLALDLHYLLTVWAGSALAEQSIFAWAMRQLYHHPVLDISSLSAEAEWKSGDIVQLIPTDLTTDDMMRIWDALKASYRLSVPYVARVVLIDADSAPESRRVVATRLSLNNKDEEVADS